MSIVLAGNESASYTPPELFAGESDIVTNAYTVASGQNLVQYAVVGMLTADNTIVAWDPAGADGSENAVGIMCFAIDATGGAVEAPIYTGGFFNTDALDWGAATALQIEAAFIGTNISHRSLSGA